MAERARVLVVDDSEAIRELVSAALRSAGYVCVETDTASEAFRWVEREHFALVVLDIGLPDADGREVLTKIRRSSSVPVILLTARSDEVDRIVGLELGADDYVVKPFSPGELAARAKAVLRRSDPGGGGSAGSTDIVEIGSLRIDGLQRRVTLQGQQVALTQREFDLLHFLAGSPGQVFTRSQLLDHVWNSSEEWQDSATVTEHIRRIRQKLQDAGDETDRLRTIRGVGYSFDTEGG